MDERIVMEVADKVHWAEWEQWAEVSLIEFATLLIARNDAERAKGGQK